MSDQITTQEQIPSTPPQNQAPVEQNQVVNPEEKLGSNQSGEQSLKEKNDPNPLKILLKRLTFLTEIGSLVAVGTLVICLVFIYLADKQVKLYLTNRQQISAALYNSSDLQNTVSFLEAQKQQTDVITQALPNEVGFIEFVKSLELIASQHSRDSRFQFSNSVTDQNSTFVPIKITMTTDSSNLNEFLKKTEKLAYLFHILKIETSSLSAGDDLWSIKIEARLYVNSKFRLSTAN